MPFDVVQLALQEILLVTPTVIRDERGYFLESYKSEEFRQLGIPDLFVQDNHSRSAIHVVRGLHYQIHPRAQAKLVRCCRGAIFDVCVDIRKHSATFGRWVGAELTEENCSMLYVPVGFAHGFVSLAEGSEIIYKCSAEYSRDHDRGIFWNDPAIGIRWPVRNPVLSSKDMNNPCLSEVDEIYLL
jgi:dTDP-4-dehydrorhamnose 3,5-epimerase